MHDPEQWSMPVTLGLDANLEGNPRSNNNNNNVILNAKLKVK